MNPRKKTLIDALAKDLHERRLALVGDVDEQEEDLTRITQERTPEMEEDAQKNRIAAVLERLSGRERQTLEEIDEALLRIVDGTYGTCVSCDRPIAIARLRALPTTRLCINCARAQEGRQPGGVQEEPASRMPSDLSLLDDEEIEAALYDLVLEDGDIDMEELQISCRGGVVTLQGTLPTDAQHRALTELLQDVGGLGDVVDHVETQSRSGERSELSKAPPRAKQLLSAAQEGIENGVQSARNGASRRTSARPVRARKRKSG